MCYYKKSNQINCIPNYTKHTEFFNTNLLYDWYKTNEAKDYYFDRFVFAKCYDNKVMTRNFDLSCETEDYLSFGKKLSQKIYYLFYC
jgi:hypothetical protein